MTEDFKEIKYSEQRMGVCLFVCILYMVVAFKQFLFVTLISRQYKYSSEQFQTDQPGVAHNAEESAPAFGFCDKSNLCAQHVKPTSLGFISCTIQEDRQQQTEKRQNLPHKLEQRQRRKQGEKQPSTFAHNKLTYIQTIFNYFSQPHSCHHIDSVSSQKWTRNTTLDIIITKRTFVIHLTYRGTGQH